MKAADVLAEVCPRCKAGLGATCVKRPTRGRLGKFHQARVERAEQTIWRASEPLHREIQAELRWISDNPIEDELRIIASGGRIPSLEEVNARNRDPLLEAVIEAIEDEGH
ncbi:MAG TPA: hypothetical protein VH141_32715 [Pseudonocardia sp.]|jgi:hypothetical protein|nr:hypothetical protein [Pseudonocardia sp.]